MRYNDTYVPLSEGEKFGFESQQRFGTAGTDFFHTPTFDRGRRSTSPSECPVSVVPNKNVRDNNDKTCNDDKIYNNDEIYSGDINIIIGNSYRCKAVRARRIWR